MAVRVMVWIGLLAKADLGHVTVTGADVVVVDGAEGRQRTTANSVQNSRACVDY